MERTKPEWLIIADSSALISLVNTADSNHTIAVRLVESLQIISMPILIPFVVFVETTNALGKILGRPAALGFIERVQRSALFSLVDTSSSGDGGIDKFRVLPASVSLTDCLVMAAADEYETKYIFGFDKVFQKNGYRLPGSLQAV